jgi:uncharacterized LabA/DUF88 family protein
MNNERMVGDEMPMSGSHQAYAFIDGQNLHLSIRSQGWTLDYGAFRRYLTDKFHVSRAFYFIGFLATNADLYELLQREGYILIFKPTLMVRGVLKGNVDAELVLHAMIEYENYEQAVIVSGDGDFHCLVKYLKAKGKLGKLIVPDDTRYSSLYRNYGSDIMGVNKLRGKLELKKREA